MKKNYLNFKKASLALSFVALFGATGVKAQVLVAGSVTGTTTAYTSLSSAFAAINTGSFSGAITISITANVTEPTPPTALLASGGTSTYTSVYIRPAGGNFTISSSATPTANRGIIELTGADNVTIDGDDPSTSGLQNLSIVSTVTTTPGIANIRLASNSATGADGATNIIVKNCIIKGSRDAATSSVVSYGIQFYDAATSATSTPTVGANSNTGITIQGNNITRCAYGIHAIGNSTTYLNAGLLVTTNTLGSVSTATDNIGLRGIDVSYTDFNSATNTASVILNDITFGNTSAGVAVMGIELGNANAGIRIGRNNIHDALASPLGAYGIGLTDAISSSSGIVIRNNFIRDIKGSASATTAASQASGIGGVGVMVTNTVTGIIINNNTIAQLAAGAIGSCVQLNNAAATLSQFRNNALVNNIANAVAMCFYSSSTVNIAGGTLNNNDYYANASANVAYYNGANRATLAAFATATGMDANSYSVSPNFVSATDLHIVPGQYSFLESTGASTAITGVANDIDGDVRPGPAGSVYGGALNPDIGADEFDGLIANCVTPTITIVSTPTTGLICSGGSVTLTASGAGASGTYTWSRGSVSNTIAVSNTVVVSPTVATTYSVLGTTSLACTAMNSISISVDNTPTLSVSTSTTAICLNRTVSITASGATNYTIASPTGTIANGASFSPTATAAYTVSGSNACATPTSVVTITVNPLPTLTVSTSSSTLCSGPGITLSVNGSAVTYTWAVNGSTNTAITPTPAAGTGTSTTVNYSVTASSAFGCTNTAVSIVTVVTTPVITPVASPPGICTGGTATLFLSGSTSYTWLPMNVTGVSSVAVTPTIVPTTTTAVHYSVTSANGPCVSTKTVDLIVNPLPNLFAVLNTGSSSASVCSGASASLTAGGALNFTWTPVTTPSTGANVVIHPTVTTTYTFVGNDGTCSNSNTITVPVNPIPTLSITSTPSAICIGSIGNLTGAGGINYTWTASSSTQTLSGTSVNVNPTVTTAYTLIGDNNFGCTNTTGYVLFVNSLPTVNITPSNTLVCLGRTVTLVANSSNATAFQWSLPGGGSSTGATLHATPTVTASYTVTAGNLTTGCVNVKTSTISVFNPSFTVPASTAICKGSTLTLSASGAASYTWQPGNYTGPTVPFSPSVTTIYTVVGTGTVFNVFNNQVLSCQATYTMGMTVNPNPTVTAAASQTIICRQETSTLTAHGALNYTWTPAPASGSGSVVVVNSTDFPNYINSMNYTVTGADANNCKAKATLTVITSGCVGIDEQTALNNSLLIYPNPNNGEFTVQTDQNITLSVMNELGQQIRMLTLDETNNHQAMVSDMANGIYIIVGSNQNGRISQKVIISK